MSSPNQQIAQTVANTLTGNKGVKQIQFAVTGDAISDLMAGIRALCDDSGLSARQIQFVFECYEKLYKDAADDTDKRERERASWPINQPLKWDPQLDHKWHAGDSSCGMPELMQEAVRKFRLSQLDRMNADAEASKSALQNDFDNACNALHDQPPK